MMVRWTLFVIITLGAGLWAFATGRDFAQSRVIELEQIVDGLSNENLRLRETINGLEVYARDGDRNHVAAINAGDCDDRVETAQFEVRTGRRPPSQFNAATLADNRIVVTAAGTPARDQDGGALTFFDPSLPVRVEFNHIDGARSTATGVLPFQHVFPAAGSAYRFLLATGAPNFISISAEQCNY